MMPPFASFLAKKLCPTYKFRAFSSKIVKCKHSFTSFLSDLWGKKMRFWLNICNFSPKYLHFSKIIPTFAPAHQPGC